MHEPDGYTEANDFVMRAVAESDGTLRSLCRVQPKDPGCVDEARRCLDAGANGIKLHPRAEQFTLSEPSVRELVAAAHEHKATVLIHAGRGIPALGEDTVRLSGEFPEARMILAHCAISDLSWLWRELPDHPNLYIDTAWWAPADVLAMFALCPPSNIVWASDSPYGRPIIGATQTMRMALQAGLTPDQLRAVMGGQMEHVLAGEPRLELGPPPGAPQKALDPLLERVVTHLTTVMGRMFVRADFAEPLALARLACAVGDDAPQAEVCAAVLELLDLFDEHLAPPEEGRPIPAGRAPARVRPDRRPHARRRRCRRSPTPRTRRARRPSCTSPGWPGRLAAPPRERQRRALKGGFGRAAATSVVSMGHSGDDFVDESRLDARTSRSR